MTQFNHQKKHRCLVKKGGHFEFINTVDIAYVNSEDGITFLYTFQGKRHVYNNTIEGLIGGLDDKSFFQINRGQIININAIQKIHPYFNQRMKIEPLPNLKKLNLVVSRAKIQRFKEWIDA